MLSVDTWRHDQRVFASQIEDAIRKVMAYEQDLAMAMALSLIDIDTLKHKAEEAAALSLLLAEDHPLSQEDALALELLAWFKLEFFSWVESPACSFCQNPSTQAIGTTNPTAEEAQYLASRTELYSCHLCATITRFPRYNDPVKLLETRQGRCGEWANCFTLCCRAAGLDARLVLDWTDHVWTEYYSSAQRRWIHLDPCEAAYDTPLLYEAGWGKKMSYLIAVGRHGVLDVTKRYTRKYAEGVMHRRTIASESWIEGYLQQMTRSLRTGNLDLTADEIKRLEMRDIDDVREMEKSTMNPLSENEANLPGRLTGSEAWRAARQEDGGKVNNRSNSNSNASDTANKTMSTRYQWIRNEGNNNIDEKRNRIRICGGVTRASGENAPTETATKAFDDNPSTKWLAFGAQNNTTWLEYRLLPTADPVSLSMYAITSGNDAPERDPETFFLEAWDDASDAWVVIDRRSGVRFHHRGQRIEFEVALRDDGNDKALRTRRWRLRIERVLDPSRANSVQLSCWELYYT